jgi:hypothetical protein
LPAWGKVLSLNAIFNEFHWLLGIRCFTPNDRDGNPFRGDSIGGHRYLLYTAQHNAVKYTPNNGSVDVKLETSNGFAVSVSDSIRNWGV